MSTIEMSFSFYSLLVATYSWFHTLAPTTQNNLLRYMLHSLMKKLISTI